jgi:hypothetical protein
MTKFYRSSESGTEELVLTPRATDAQVGAALNALVLRGLTHATRDDARAALAAAQAVAPAPWPTSEQLAKTLCCPQFGCDNDKRGVVCHAMKSNVPERRAVDALYRNALFPKAQP